MAQGLWNIAGFNLPDFGISEKLGVGPQNAAVSPSYGKLGDQGVKGATDTKFQGYLNVDTSKMVPINQLNGSQNSGSGSNKGIQPGQNGYVNPNTQQADPYAQIKNEINSAWDSYLSSLQSTADQYLPEQVTAQQGVVNTQYDNSVNQVNTQKAKSLRDITSNMRNAFQAGNAYLGTRGAGDSSAANQYQYALSKDAAKQTGQLNEFVNGQLNNLTSQRDTQMQQIAQWFSQQQMAIKQQIASGQLQRSQDIATLSKQALDQAIQWKNQVEAQATNTYNGLLSWAASNSTNVSQLTQNISQIPQVMGQFNMNQMNGRNMPAAGYGYNSNERLDLFGNPIR